MLMTGKNVRQTSDPLTPVTVEQIWKGLTTQNSALHTLIQRLRLIKVMDSGQYRMLKTTLPYLVCGRFHPAIRRKEHFVSTTYFMLDLDHLVAAEKDPYALKEQLAKDERIHLAFVSPGNDGLKLLFRLAQKVDDSSYFPFSTKSLLLILPPAMDWKPLQISEPAMFLVAAL